mmetsp:Transcript_4691/g.15310  ORF Transcript_4691/g.15310 Transcript_4691/m.15310 type:complete len:203 (+) Transcript_4691:1464-2072(+)
MSNSHHSAPPSAAALNDATVFSRIPAPDARFARNPRCPITAHPDGSKSPGKCVGNGFEFKLCVLIRLCSKPFFMFFNRDGIVGSFAEFSRRRNDSMSSPSMLHSRLGATPKCSRRVGTMSVSRGAGKSSPLMLNFGPLSIITQPALCWGNSNKPLTPFERSCRPPPSFQSCASNSPCIPAGISARHVPPEGEVSIKSQSSVG